MGNIVGFWTKSTWAAVALKPLFGPFVEMWGPGILSFGLPFRFVDLPKSWWWFAHSSLR
jgi:hypothetical protein